MERIYWICI